MITKYIRTKDGVYEVEKKLSYCYLDKNDNEYLFEDILSQADTIEELCDEFVFINVGIYKDKVYMFKTLEESKKCNDLYDKCYGAIYTDKGLIYVAKMNYKKGFELL